jgi:hypothetical protein
VPQFEVVDRLVSQPSDATPLQFPYPAAHAPKVHDPVAQLAPVAFAGLQATPQPPQFVVVVRTVSHPFDTTASQLPHPAAHAANEQTPLEHAAPVAFADAHAVSVCAYVHWAVPLAPEHVPGPLNVRRVVPFAQVAEGALGQL